MVINLTPKRLIKFLNKHYDNNYKITEEIAVKVIQDCEAEYDGEFTEEELLNMVEKYLN